MSLPSILQNLDFAAGTVSAPAPAPAPSGGGSAGGRYVNQRTGRAIHWTPDVIWEADHVYKYKKTKEDYELERLLKEAIKREDLEKQAKKIAKVAQDKVTSVQDVSRAARAVERELLTLQQTSKLTQKEAEKRQRKVKEEEDLIIALLLDDF